MQLYRGSGRSVDSQNSTLVRVRGEPETLSGPTGAILSPGNGTVELSLDKNQQTISYKLTYTPMTSSILQAHFHFGKRHVPGGIMVFFCTNGTGPAGTPSCPPPPATVTGTWIAGSVQAVPGQRPSNRIPAYGNIHTANFPAGEIRGQIRQEEDDNNQ